MIAPSPCPVSVHETVPPPGEYRDQHVVIDYSGLVPSPDPRRGVDKAYVRKVTQTPVLLEQVYYDAAHGHQRAAWLACELEATARSGGRQVARYLATLRCQTMARCEARWDELPLSRDTASGQRLLSIPGEAFRDEARILAFEDELIGKALMVLVGARIAARVSSRGAPRGRVARPGALEPKSFTAANFRENLRRLTGRTPKGAHAHHVFPQRFAKQFPKAGINIHNPRYGAWWHAREHQRAAKVYNARWGEFLATSPSAEQILQFGRELASDHGFQIYY